MRGQEERAWSWNNVVKLGSMILESFGTRVQPVLRNGKTLRGLLHIHAVTFNVSVKREKTDWLTAFFNKSYLQELIGSFVYNNILYNHACSI